MKLETGILTEWTGATDAEPARVPARWLPLATALWWALALPNLILTFAGIPAYYHLVQQPCADLDTCAIAGATTAEGLRGFLALGVSTTEYATFWTLFWLGVILIWSGVGFYLYVRRPHEPMALLAAFFLVVFNCAFPGGFATALAIDYPAFSLPVTLMSVLGPLSIALFCLIFPNGRLVPRWTALVIPLILAQAIGAAAPPDSPLNANNAPAWINAALALAVYGTIIISQIYRFRRRSTLAERQQTKWVVFGIVLVAVGYLALNILFHVGLLQPDNPWTSLLQIAYPLLNFLFPLTISIAILRSRLWDIDTIISRTLVYGVLTASVVGVYVLIVGYLGAALHSGGSLFISLIATGIVAMFFQPWRDLLQRNVNRLVYGLRDEPYVVLAGLGQRVQSTLDPAALLSVIVTTVRETLKLSYAAIEVNEGSRVTLTAAGDPPTKEALRLALAYQNESVGALLVAPRKRDVGLTSADLRLLGDLSLQIGAAVHMLRLSGDLQRSRERLVSAREEERRRLRRDLHDGLGPMLSAILLKVGMTRSLQRREAGAADDLLGQLETEIELAISDIRRLVYNLRPPALDELGLVGAIREYVARLDPDAGESIATLKVTVEAPTELPPLPAAVEVAAYRIVQEAVTNVIRHARARTCHIRILITDILHIDVTDDGVGIAEADRAGIGLTSMRERAEELGGALTIRAGALGGTHITARLPLGTETVSGELS